MYEGEWECKLYDEGDGVPRKSSSLTSKDS